MVTSVLLLLSIVLVLIGVVTLIIGIFSNTLAWVFVSIGSTLAAGVVLYVLSRLGRKAAVGEGVTVPAATGVAPAAAPASVPEPEVTFTPAPRYAPSPETAVVDLTDEEAIFPIEDYDDLRVAEILPLLPELDTDELAVVRDAEVAGKNRASIVARIDELAAGGDVYTEASTGAGVFAAEPASDDGFPIAEYDELRVSEILPLINELEPDELEVVAARERTGANRATILSRIDGQMRAMGIAVAAPARATRASSAPKKAPAAKKAAAAKTTKAAAKAPAKASTATKATKAASKSATTKKASAAKSPSTAKKASASSKASGTKKA